MEDKKKYQYGSVVILGKKIPLTKNGLPNRVYLSKEAREIVSKYADDKKKQKKEILTNEITEILKKLG